MIPRAIALAALILAGPAAGQGTGVDFGGLTQDTSLPVEVAADSLDVDQADGTAVFSGNVLVTQGEMKLSAGSVRVLYADPDAGAGRIRQMQATGGVTLVNGAEAAEASEATYSIADGTVEMTGDVLLTQGQTALSGERLTIDLNSGTGRMEGRVRTVFQTDGG